jgi:hypothetical protein
MFITEVERMYDGMNDELILTACIFPDSHSADLCEQRLSVNGGDGRWLTH